jgi:hypothetical protein
LSTKRREKWNTLKSIETVGSSNRGRSQHD